MKKVAFIIESNAVGGAERVLRDIVKYMDTSKFDVTVISLFKNSVYGGTSQFVDSFNCKYRWIIDNGNSIKGRVGSFLINRFPNIFFHLYISSHYDTLIAFYEGMPTTLLARVKTRIKKVAWLHTSVDLSIQDKSASNLQHFNQIYLAYDKIIGVSKGVVDGFVHLLPCLKENIHVAYNPIDLTRIQHLSLVDIGADVKYRFTFVAVGRIIPCKGYERIIEVAASLKKENFIFHVWIIGGGGHAHLVEKAMRCDVEELFTFWGNQSNPYPYMKQADCVISSSYIEGLSTVVIEGLTLGKCVVATNCNGTAEIIGKDSEYGILVGNSTDGLYKGMKKVLTDKSVKSYYEKKAFERARFFDVKNSISRIESLLNC